MNKMFSISHNVGKEDLDQLNHMNNIRYLFWIQYIAGTHWKALTHGVFDKAYFWVVKRHEIDYIKPCFENDQITISTYIGDTYGVKSERYVEFRKGEEIIAKSKTIWVLISTIDSRPVRIIPEIKVLLDTHRLD